MAADRDPDQQLRSPYDRRHKPPVRPPGIAWLGAAVTIIVQVIALVWGAAKMSSAVDDLKTTVEEGRRDLRELNNRLAAVQLQVTKLETKFDDAQVPSLTAPPWYHPQPERKR